MDEEHEELHKELFEATKQKGKVGEASRRVAELLHPHFEKENELALPVVGIARELAEGKTSPDSHKALELYEKFKAEYPKMLQEHREIVKALDELQEVATAANYQPGVEFAQKLRLHAEIEESLTYPAVLLVGSLLKHR
jgi:hypothetical protein